jgi:hypothetical protein
MFGELRFLGIRMQDTSLARENEDAASANQQEAIRKKKSGTGNLRQEVC